jgi:hypothetical protein
MLYFLSGLLLGAAFVWWTKVYVEHRRHRIPTSWPLKTRPLVNTQERSVWLWLTKVMFDQHVLIKLPVTRFTAPINQTEATHWYKLLNGVYCTFTICDVDGRVIGCVDVLGPNGLSMGNQSLKHSLLDQCNIRYLVVDPTNLPHLSQIRAAFLGEDGQSNHSQPLDSRFQDMREHLQAVVTRQRQSKAADTAPSGLAPLAVPEYPESRLASGWELNSFVSPLDSRVEEPKI